MACTRCGGGVHSAEDKVALIKYWHRCCFTCLHCGVPLSTGTANVVRDEVFCWNCCSPVAKAMRNCSRCPPKASRITSKSRCQKMNCLGFPRNCPEKMEGFFKDEMRPEKKGTCWNCSSGKNEEDVHCYEYPLPREVANYYSRGHSRGADVMNPKWKPKTLCFRDRPPACPSPGRSKASLPPCKWSRPSSPEYDNFSCTSARTKVQTCTCKYEAIKIACTSYCARCNGKVYMAERMLVSCGAYHPGCFSCFHCRKQLNLSNFNESCGEIFCKQCYEESSGTKYYGL